MENSELHVIPVNQNQYSLLRALKPITGNDSLSHEVVVWQNPALYKFVVIIAPADGLAPLGARPSAGTVMANH